MREDEGEEREEGEEEEGEAEEAAAAEQARSESAMRRHRAASAEDLRPSGAEASSLKLKAAGRKHRASSAEDLRADVKPKAATWKDSAGKGTKGIKGQPTPLPSAPARRRPSRSAEDLRPPQPLPVSPVSGVVEGYARSIYDSAEFKAMSHDEQGVFLTMVAANNDLPAEQREAAAIAQGWWLATDRVRLGQRRGRIRKRTFQTRRRPPRWPSSGTWRSRGSTMT